MSNIRKAVFAVVALVAGMAAAANMLKKTWASEEAELTKAFSAALVTAGAPSKVQADQVSACIMEIVVPAAEKLACPLEGDSYLALDACLQANEQLQAAFTQATMDCLHLLIAPQ